MKEKQEIERKIWIRLDSERGMITIHKHSSSGYQTMRMTIKEWEALHP